MGNKQPIATKSFSEGKGDAIVEHSTESFDCDVGLLRDELLQTLMVEMGDDGADDIFRESHDIELRREGGAHSIWTNFVAMAKEFGVFKESGRPVEHLLKFLESEGIVCALCAGGPKSP